MVLSCPVGRKNTRRASAWKSQKRALNGLLGAFSRVRVASALTNRFLQLIITRMSMVDKPYITAAEAALALGYTHGGYLTTLCTAGKIPGAYKSGRIWMLPSAWVEAKKAQDAAQGIVRGAGRVGRPVTTGAGLRRRDRGGAGGRSGSTGRPPGRPRKAES